MAESTLNVMTDSRAAFSQAAHELFSEYQQLRVLKRTDYNQLLLDESITPSDIAASLAQDVFFLIDADNDDKITAAELESFKNLVYESTDKCTTLKSLVESNQTTNSWGRRLSYLKALPVLIEAASFYLDYETPYVADDLVIAESCVTEEPHTQLSYKNLDHVTLPDGKTEIFINASDIPKDIQDIIDQCKDMSVDENERMDQFLMASGQVWEYYNIPHDGSYILQFPDGLSCE